MGVLKLKLCHHYGKFHTDRKIMHVPYSQVAVIVKETEPLTETDRILQKILLVNAQRGTQGLNACSKKIPQP